MTAADISRRALVEMRALGLNHSTYAEHVGIVRQNFCEFLAGRRAPPTRLLIHFGLRKRVVYSPVEHP